MAFRQERRAGYIKKKIKISQKNIVENKSGDAKSAGLQYLQSVCK